MQRVLSLIMTLFLMLQTLFGLTGEQYKVYANIRYGDAQRDLVTIYVPNKAYSRSYNGCILYLHGGSWMHGDKEDMAHHCQKMAMKGYITATMSYSLCTDGKATNVTIYTMMDEVTQCIQAIRKFGNRRGLNITKLATSGYSAGAHISMMYSYSRPEDSPIELAFTANRAGPSDLTTKVWGFDSYRYTTMLTGVTVTDEMKRNGEADRLAREISPVTYVNKNTLPSIFAYGGSDPQVTSGNREAMEKVFRQNFGENGNHYEYIFFPMSGHALMLDPVSEAEYDDAVCRYCRSYFGY